MKSHSIVDHSGCNTDRKKQNRVQGRLEQHRYGLECGRKDEDAAMALQRYRET